MAKYLYGLSIKGIQSFIFQTNKLKEIAGASEWIESVCQEEFQAAVGTTPETYKKNILQAAAGNIKYIFDDRKTCQTVVCTFVKKLKTKIPDANIVQAVIEYEEGKLASALQQINARLEEQRNRVSIPHATSLMISKRSQRTGKVAYKPVTETGEKKPVWVDRTQYQLRASIKTTSLSKKLTGNENLKLPTDFEQIALGQEKSWLAVVHADGNDMGAKFRELFNNTEKKSDEQVKKAYKELSMGLGEKTEAAAQAAFNKHISEEKGHPIRPIIIGGDDVTFVMRGDLALDFTRTYLQEFAEGTKILFQELRGKYSDIFKNKENDSITACAGIAYVKSHYPFHYAANLAEELTKEAKKMAEVERKGDQAKQSCLVFHKVQSSFVEDYDAIVKKELTAGTDGNIRLNFGPYFIGNAPANYASAEQLSEWLKIIHEKDAPLGSLRNWLTELYQNEDVANHLWDRMLRLSKNRDYVARLGLDNHYKQRHNADGTTYSHTHIFDVISLASIHQAEK